MKKSLLEKYSRDGAGVSNYSPKTVNLTENNAKKLVELDIFLARLVRDYLENTSKKFLVDNYHIEENRQENLVNRKTTSVTLTPEQHEKIENINFSALVNDIVKSL